MGTSTAKGNGSQSYMRLIRAVHVIENSNSLQETLFSVHPLCDNIQLWIFHYIFTRIDPELQIFSFDFLSIIHGHSSCLPIQFLQRIQFFHCLIICHNFNILQISVIHSVFETATFVCFRIVDNRYSHLKKKYSFAFLDEFIVFFQEKVEKCRRFKNTVNIYYSRILKWIFIIH